MVNGPLDTPDERRCIRLRPCIIVPTFWTRPRGRFVDRLINVYDHPTPIGQEGTLAACLRSLEQVRGLDRVIVIVAATDPSIEHQAEDQVQEIIDDIPGLDAMVFGPAELGSLHRRLEQLEFADMIHGVSLTGYGAVRNLGLIVAAILGHDVAVFVDDDQVVDDPDFLEKALYAIGVPYGEGGPPILAKSGYYVDSEGRYQSHDEAPWYDIFWRRRDAYNKALSVVAAPPRIRKSTVAFGGCMTLHRDMFCSVSFDPYIVRGEDIDYVINTRMHGGDVFLDGEWSVLHQPPKPASEARTFRQDVYRFIYEHRKIEFSKSQVDLHRVTHESLDPYPGDFVGHSIMWKAAATAMMRAVVSSERGKYLQVAKAALTDASRYARDNCDRYFDFQRRWPLMMDNVWEDVALKSLFTGERRLDRSAITGRFPVLRTD